MSIIEQDIYKLSNLSKLYVDEQNIKKIVDQINKTLLLVEKLNDLDTNNIEPMFHSDEQAKQRLRLDEVTETNIRDSLQNVVNKDQIERGLYLVPKVIEQ